MVRVDLMIPEEQVKFLKDLPGTFSQHVRTAITNYLQQFSQKASVSPSRKGGKNG